MKIEYQIFCGDSYYIEGFKRYRSSFRKIFRYLIAVLKVLGLAILSFGVFVSTHNQSYLLLSSCVILITSILFGSKIDRFFLIRNIRKSPHYADSLILTFTDEGVYMKSKVVDMKLSWSAFTKAKAVKDGWLLFQGPKLYNWLADADISDKSQLEAFKELLERKVLSL